MTDPDAHPVVGIGELLWDCFPERRLPGGAPANVAFHAAQLGHPARIASRVGDDEAGSGLIDHLRSHGLSTELIQLDESLPTGQVTVDTRDPSHPSYVIHRGVAWEAIAFDEPLERRVREAAALCVGTLAQRGSRSRVTIGRCLEAATRAWRVYDVNLRRDGYRREWIEATLPRVHAVKLNLDEVRELASMLELGAVDPQRFARALIERYGLELVCVTRAERGSLMVGVDEVVDTPGKPVAVVDGVGAGDAFTAALISARLRGWPLRRTAWLANEVGARVASRSGAMPDLREEIAGLLTGGPAGSES